MRGGGGKERKRNAAESVVIPAGNAVTKVPSLRDSILLLIYPALTCRAFMCRRFAADSLFAVSVPPVNWRTIFGGPSGTVFLLFLFPWIATGRRAALGIVRPLPAPAHSAMRASRGEGRCRR